jgi:phasin family protein
LMMRGAMAVSLLRYIKAGVCAGAGEAYGEGFKCFILLQFGALMHCGCNPVVQRTKIPLTAPRPLPRMELLRRTIEPRPRRLPKVPMKTVNPFAEFSSAAVEAAARITRISMDSAERTMAIQLDYAKGAVKQATITARALSQVKDVNELATMRARIAENALENAMGYSRSLYEVASDAQSELGKLAEERMSVFQQTVAESVDQAAKSAPAGGDLVAAAFKSSLATTTAAFDTFNKAARNVASYADASVRTPARGKK